MTRFIAVALTILLLAGNRLCPAAEDAHTETSDAFATDVLPILSKHCHSCHGGENRESGLRLDVRDAAIIGGDSGKAWVAGQSDSSLLIQLVSGVDPDRVMPPEGERLAAEDVTKLRRWIDQGAYWPESLAGVKERNQHWAYQALVHHEPPSGHNVWGINAIDRFVNAKLQEHGLAPSPEADRQTLIRRLHLDLIGLLPSVADVDAFVADERPDAYERVVDRLLASSHFGERWGRHWLDMARYADSDGYEKDNPRPDAHRWRDWVIQAINDDMPFDQFTIEQLAGDLLADASDMQILATAFHRQTLTNTEGGADQEQFRVEACFDRTETTSAVWLGLTVGCARCHSHKYDAISQREYYQLFSFFNNGDETTHLVPKSAEEIEMYQRDKALHDRQVAAVTKQLQSEQALLDHDSANEPSIKPLMEKLAELRKKEPPKPEIKARVLRQRTQDPRTTFVLRRGEFLEPIKDAIIEPAGLATLPPLQPRDENVQADRLDLARWLVSSENALTSRVTANHVWRHLFGVGIVKTANDFGVRGEPPTHPELLDWLALKLIGQHPGGEVNAWSRKSLIKLIVMSATYRQSSQLCQALLDHDPQNQWLARQSRMRVEGEVVRDISLDVAGILSRKVGGPSVFPALPPGIAELSYAGNFKWTVSDGDDRYRRGVYTFFKRTSPHPNLITFDCPDANVTCMDRNRSNTPLQSLVTLNNETFSHAARLLASRILSRQELTSDMDRVNYAFRLCLSRSPTSFETSELLQLISDSRQIFSGQPDEANRLVEGSQALSHASLSDHAAWIVTSRIMINLDEFITRQ